MGDEKIIISRKELLIRGLGILIAAYVLMCTFLNFNECFSVLGLYSKIWMVILSTAGVLTLLVYRIKNRKQIDKTIKPLIFADIVFATLWNAFIIAGMYAK